MSENVILFGKHKGKSITEVMGTDPQYIDWLTKQDWFKERNPALFQTINTVIVHHSDGPEETPAHNALQALFLKPEQQEVVIGKYITLPWGVDGHFAIPDKQTVAIDFEPVDVFLRVTSTCRSFRDDYSQWNIPERLVYLDSRLVTVGPQPGCCASHINQGAIGQTRVLRDKTTAIVDFYIEVKPSIGDDYPAVIRQVKQKRDMVKSRNMSAGSDEQHWIVYADQFTGTTVTRDQMVAMLNHAGIDVIWHREA